MNILVPDIWLREYLKTKATPEQIKEHLSLCGPSVERIYGEGKDAVYDIEITGNRPDAMSVIGIAREAAAILPRFGIPATLLGDPFAIQSVFPKGKTSLKLTVKTDSVLNPRWTSVVFEGVAVKASPTWLTKYLELAGIRSLNNVVDITNFLMRAYGQPAHVFDYDAIVGHKMTLRASKKGEKLTTLDGKSHRLPGDDIVIADGSGKLIDLCGIMGGENSSVKDNTKRVILFLQTYDASHIRKTSMALAHRTEAGSLFEKGLDPELVGPVFLRGIELMIELTGGHMASTVTDIYPTPPKLRTVTTKIAKVHSYIGNISATSIKETLTSLGFATKITKDAVIVTVPSFRRDVGIDVDIIEEIARIYGYHNIPSRLPEREPPMVIPDASLSWEEEIKVRLRDWGYTELYTYSMISERLMDIFGLDKKRAYKISNPLSEEWVYMRPALLPSMLETVKQNMHTKDSLSLFELSMIYRHRPGELPEERPILLVVKMGNAFRELKGIAEALFDVVGCPFQHEGTCEEPFDWYSQEHINIDDIGLVGMVNQHLLDHMGIKTPVTVLFIDFAKLISRAKPTKAYIPIPKYPPIVEDLSFVVPDEFTIGSLITALKKAHPLVSKVTLLDVHESTRTLHITYQDPKRNLTTDEIVPVRNKLIEVATKKFGVSLKA